EAGLKFADMTPNMRWTALAAVCLVAAVGIVIALYGSHAALLTPVFIVAVGGGVPAVLASYVMVERVEAADAEAGERGQASGEVDRGDDVLDQGSGEERRGAVVDGGGDVVVDERDGHLDPPGREQRQRDGAAVGGGVAGGAVGRAGDRPHHRRHQQDQGLVGG